MAPKKVTIPKNLDFQEEPIKELPYLFVNEEKSPEEKQKELEEIEKQRKQTGKNARVAKFFPKGSFYTLLPTFDGAGFLANLKAGDIKKPLLPEPFEKSFVVDGKEIRVVSQLKKDLKKIGSPREPLCYDLIEACVNLIDPRRNALMAAEISGSELWFTATDQVEAGTETLSMDEVKRRYAFWVGIGHLLSNDDILKKIVKAAPKKKDGTLNRRDLLRIASAFVYTEEEEASYDTLILEIYTKAEKDDQLTIRAAARRISDDELTAVGKDFVSTCWRELGLEPYLKIEKPKEEEQTDSAEKSIGKENEYEGELSCLRVEGNTICVEDTENTERFLKELDKFPAIIAEDGKLKLQFPLPEKFAVTVGGTYTVVSLVKLYRRSQEILNIFAEAGGAYDYNDYMRKLRAYADEKQLGSFISEIVECRSLETKQYSLEISVLRFAEALTRIFGEIEEKIATAQRKKNGTLNRNYTGYIKICHRTKLLIPPDIFMNRVYVSNGSDYEITFFIREEPTYHMIGDTLKRSSLYIPEGEWIDRE